MLTLLLSLAVPSQTASRPSAEIQSLGGGRHVVTIVGLDADERASQAAALAVAGRVCGGPVVLGAFEQNRRLGRGRATSSQPTRFRQEFTCDGVDSSPPAGTATGVTAEPDGVTAAAAREHADRFLRAYAGGDGDRSYAMLAPGMRAQQSLADWTAQARAHATTVGAAPVVRVAKLTWYRDPPGVPTGLYAAADFVGASEKAALICGFVALRRTEANGWEVARLESGTAPQEALRGASPNKVAEMRAALRCVDG